MGDKQWVDANDRDLLSELGASKRASGIDWEIVPVGRTGKQLMWRPVADERALAELDARVSEFEAAGRELTLPV